MTEHEIMRLELGAYLIGSLAPSERAAVARHLAGCAECRAELASLAPLPGLLGRLDAAEARNQILTPSADLLPRALEAVRTQQRRDRRRLRRWRVSAVAAGLVAVAAAVLPPLLPSGDTGTPLAVATGVAAAGTGTMQERAWGTAVVLQLSGLPPASGYCAYATARDGHTEIAATWGATSSGRANVSGATAIQRDQLAAIEVRTMDGRDLLTLPG